MMWKAKFALPWHRKQDRNFGEGVRGARETSAQGKASSHTFNSVNRSTVTTAFLLKRQATDAGKWGFDWLNCSGIAILQPLKVGQYTSRVSTFICELGATSSSLPRWD